MTNLCRNVLWWTIMFLGCPMLWAADSAQQFGTVQDPAFTDLIKRLFPLSPEQIQAFRQIVNSMQRESVRQLPSNPKPSISVQQIELAPGSAIPIIRLGHGYVTSVLFMDETGEPWPLSGYSNANTPAFNVQWDGRSNLLLIQAMESYESGNMSVQLLGLGTPVMLEIVSDQDVLDYRIDFHVPGRGPMAKPDYLSSNSMTSRNSANVLLQFLGGVAPVGAKSLAVQNFGELVRAWTFGGKLYLRTNLTVMAPAWFGTMSSMDGMKIYELPIVPSIMLQKDGQLFSVTLEGL